ncbi:MAG: hypothetical protein M1334_00725 [Patescibacteria group bacterium]|nr:hypothetical protein [Patescibacteria group bacterium]
MSKKTIIILLVVVIALTAFLRFYQITTTPPGLYPDEAMNGNNALEALATNHFKVFYPENNGREGLFMNIQAIFLKYLMPLENGNTAAWMLRLPSAFFGVFTVLGLFFLARELLSTDPESKMAKHKDAIALFAAFLLATSFWHILFSRIGFRAIMSPFFMVWAAYLFIKAINQKTKSDKTGPELNWIKKHRYLCCAAIGGIFFGLGFYSYIDFRVMPILFLLFIPYFYKKRNFWAATVVFIAVTVLVALPIGIYFLQHPADFFGRTGELSVSASSHPLTDLASNIVKTALMFNYHGDYNWRQNFAGAPELFWPVGILFLIGLILAAAKFKKLRFSFLLSWLILAALPVVISNEGIPHALRAILMIPPVFILAALGGWWLYDKVANSPFCALNNNKLIFNIFVVVFLFLLVVQAYTSYFIAWAQNPNVPGAFNQNYVDIANEINTFPVQTKKYVVVEAGGVLVNGIPMPAQTVMFLTNTFLPQNQDAKNIHYLLPNQVSEILKAPFQSPISIFYLR